MIVELVDSLAGLLTFRPEWERFVRTVGVPTPFQRPDWLLTWWQHFGSGQLHVMVFREAAEVAGVLPCFLHEWQGRRQLTLIGSGISDYLDPIFEPRLSHAIVQELERHLAAFRDWDVCDWQDLSANTPLGMAGRLAGDTPCTQIELKPPFETFLAARPKDLRRNLQRYRTKAEAEGEIRFRVTPEADPELLDALIELHGARWRQSGQPGTIAANGAAQFLRAASAELARRDLVRIFTVYFKQQVAAILLAFRNQTTIFSYLSAFDPEYERFGFGRALLLEALRYAQAEGYSRWNFLRGEEPYKFSWGAQMIPKCRFILERLHAAGAPMPS